MIFKYNGSIRILQTYDFMWGRGRQPLQMGHILNMVDHNVEGIRNERKEQRW